MSVNVSAGTKTNFYRRHGRNSILELIRKKPWTTKIQKSTIENILLFFLVVLDLVDEEDITISL